MGGQPGYHLLTYSLTQVTHPVTPCNPCTYHAGHANHLTLQALWEDMRNALQQWLGQRQLSGGLMTVDRATYQRAAATYQVLQEAAARGPEYLEQVSFQVSGG
jgi:hypothetical protein